MPESPPVARVVGDTLELSAEHVPGTRLEIRALVERAQKGDRTALPGLRKLLAPPGAADALGGNLPDRAVQLLLTTMAGGNLFFREAVARKVDELRAELSGPSPSAVERLLAERAVCCWLHLYHLEHLYAGKGSMSLEVAGHYQRCIDRAHKRYLSALKTLSEVRKIGVTVQLNIARKQVNVASGGS